MLSGRCESGLTYIKNQIFHTSHGKKHRGMKLVKIMALWYPAIMKKDIHPTYYQHAAVRCGCGYEMTVGSTKERLEIEICSHCHPFYTGGQKIVDAAGRVEKFRQRLAKKQ